MADRYPGGMALSFPQTMELETRMEQALKSNPAMEQLEFFRNENGFLCAKAK